MVHDVEDAVGERGLVGALEQVSGELVVHGLARALGDQRVGRLLHAVVEEAVREGEPVGGLVREPLVLERLAERPRLHVEVLHDGQDEALADSSSQRSAPVRAGARPVS